MTIIKNLYPLQKLMKKKKIPLFKKSNVVAKPQPIRLYHGGLSISYREIRIGILMVIPTTMLIRHPNNY